MLRRTVVSIHMVLSVRKLFLNEILFVVVHKNLNIAIFSKLLLDTYVHITI
jgi:hypothetical protein